MDDDRDYDAFLEGVYDYMSRYIHLSPVGSADWPQLRQSQATAPENTLVL